MISKDERDSIAERAKRHRGSPPGSGYPSNDELSAWETYDWHHDPPAHAFLYYDEAMTRVANWMGIKFGDIVWRGKIARRMGGRTQAIRVKGTNGVAYHGTCNLTGGTYCRLRRSKG